MFLEHILSSLPSMLPVHHGNHTSGCHLAKFFLSEKTICASHFGNCPMPQLTEELIRKRPGLDPFVGTVQHGETPEAKASCFLFKKIRVDQY